MLLTPPPPIHPSLTEVRPRITGLVLGNSWIYLVVSLHGSVPASYGRVCGKLREDIPSAWIGALEVLACSAGIGAPLISVETSGTWPQSRQLAYRCRQVKFPTGPFGLNQYSFKTIVMPHLRFWE